MKTKPNQTITNPNQPALILVHRKDYSNADLFSMKKDRDACLFFAADLMEPNEVQNMYAPYLRVCVINDLIVQVCKTVLDCKRIILVLEEEQTSIIGRLRLLAQNIGFTLTTPSTSLAV